MVAAPNTVYYPPQPNSPYQPNSPGFSLNQGAYPYQVAPNQVAPNQVAPNQVAPPYQGAYNQGTYNQGAYPYQGAPNQGTYNQGASTYPGTPPAAFQYSNYPIIPSQSGSTPTTAYSPQSTFGQYPVGGCVPTAVKNEGFCVDYKVVPNATQPLCKTIWTCQLVNGVKEWVKMKSANYENYKHQKELLKVVASLQNQAAGSGYGQQIGSYPNTQAVNSGFGQQTGSYPNTQAVNSGFGQQTVNYPNNQVPYQNVASRVNTQVLW